MAQEEFKIIYDKVCEDVFKCTKCGLGKFEEGQQDPHVFGEGSNKSGIMFVAEAPGLQEVLHKQPLTTTGLSGRLYEKVLKALDLKREDVYTTNTTLCRPPNNRDPRPYEVELCSGFFKKQLELVKPKIVVTFGRFAAQTMVGSFKITKEHGILRDSERFNTKVFPLYHPAYVKAYGSQKVRDDFKKDIKKLKLILAEMSE